MTTFSLLQFTTDDDSLALMFGNRPLVWAEGAQDEIAVQFSKDGDYVATGPELLPLYYSHVADQLEHELKQLFIQLFDTYIRADERYVNALGSPQLGVRELVEQSLAADGLSIYRGATGPGSYLLRAWRAHNPKRGLHLLKSYLQLLWPNVWTAHQMWQDKGEVYPTELVEEDGGDHYLTSRVHVSLPARSTSGADVNAISSGLKASVPARVVMQLSIFTEEAFDLGVAALFERGVVGRHYEGNFT